MAERRPSQLLCRALALALAASFCLGADDEIGDPTRPPNANITSKIAQDPDEVPEEFRLTTILTARGRTIAVINGRRVQVGDVVNGAEVAAIHADRVLVRGPDGPLELRLRKPALSLRPSKTPNAREEEP